MASCVSLYLWLKPSPRKYLLAFSSVSCHQFIQYADVRGTLFSLPDKAVLPLDSIMKCHLIKFICAGKKTLMKQLFLVVSTLIKKNKYLHSSPCTINCSMFYAIVVSCKFVDSLTSLDLISKWIIFHVILTVVTVTEFSEFKWYKILRKLPTMFFSQVLNPWASVPRG